MQYRGMTKGTFAKVVLPRLIDKVDMGNKVSPTARQASKFMLRKGSLWKKFFGSPVSNANQVLIEIEWEKESGK